MVMHTFNPTIVEAEAGGAPWVRDQPGLHSNFQTSQAIMIKKEEIVQNTVCLLSIKAHKDRQQIFTEPREALNSNIIIARDLTPLFSSE